MSGARPRGRLGRVLPIKPRHVSDLRTFARRERGHYLTDGRRLFRNLNPLRGSLGGALVALEDCRSLQLVLMPAPEFARLRDV
jgi:hypothetical protein